MLFCKELSYIFSSSLLSSALLLYFICRCRSLLNFFNTSKLFRPDRVHWPLSFWCASSSARLSARASICPGALASPAVPKLRQLPIASPHTRVAAPNVRLFLKLSRSRKVLLRKLKLRRRALRHLSLLLLPPLPPRRPPLRLPLFLLLPPLRRAT